MLDVWAVNENDFYYSKDGKMWHSFNGFNYVIQDAKSLLLALSKAECAKTIHTVPIRGRDVSKCVRRYFAGQNGTS